MTPIVKFYILIMPTYLPCCNLFHILTRYYYGVITRRRRNRRVVRRTAENMELASFVFEASEKIKILEPVRTDADAFAEQLYVYQTFHAELCSKRDVVDQALESSEHLVDRMHLLMMREQFTALCKRSNERLQTLNELRPLVFNFSKLREKLEVWLSHVKIVLEEMDGTPSDMTPITDSYAKQLKLCQCNIKTTLQLFNCHHADIDEIIKESSKIAGICHDWFDASSVVHQASDLASLFETCKESVQRRRDHLEAFLIRIFHDTAERISVVMDTLRSVSSHVNKCLDGPMWNLVVINQFITENNNLLAKLHALSRTMQDIISTVHHIPEITADDVNYEKLKNNLHEATTLHKETMDLCLQRAGGLQHAVVIAEHVHSLINNITTELNHAFAVHNNPATVQRLLSDLQAAVINASPVQLHQPPNSGQPDVQQRFQWSSCRKIPNNTYPGATPPVSCCSCCCRCSTAVLSLDLSASDPANIRAVLCQLQSLQKILHEEPKEAEEEEEQETNGSGTKSEMNSSGTDSVGNGKMNGHTVEQVSSGTSDSTSSYNVPCNCDTTEPLLDDLSDTGRVQRSGVSADDVAAGKTRTNLKTRTTKSDHLSKKKGILSRIKNFITNK